MTPAILDNALTHKRVENFEGLSLMIFDECHRTEREHAYNKIMSKYLGYKLTDPNAKLPQVCTIVCCAINAWLGSRPWLYGLLPCCYKLTCCMVICLGEEGKTKSLSPFDPKLLFQAGIKVCQFVTF